MKFSIKDVFSICDQIRKLQETADLVTFTGEILNGNIHFFVQRNFYDQPISDQITKYDK